MAKLTMKEKVLQFVESKGSASFTEIQRFIVDHNFGPGTYDEAAGTDVSWGRRGKTQKCNPYRGYYCAAFWRPNNIDWSNPKGGYFIVGNDRLLKVTNPQSPNFGKYITVRNNNININI